MKRGDFCKNKDCGAITKHQSGYCSNHNKLWKLGYEQAIKDIQCQGTFNFESLNEQQTNSKGEGALTESKRAALLRVWCPGSK